MSDPYDFKNDVAAKLLIKRGDKILLVREPEFNAWMPGRLGLPGGKPLLNETLEDALKRKIKTEVGLEIDIKGLVKIIDILMPQKNVYHFLIAAEYVSGEIDTSQTESEDIDWYTQETIASMNKDDFTEFYNDELIKSYLAGTLTIIPLSTVQAQDNRSGMVLDWMRKGMKS